MNDLIPMADFETFGDWVRYRRERYGLTYAELGVPVGLTGGQVCRMEERNDHKVQGSNAYNGAGFRSRLDDLLGYLRSLMLTETIEKIGFR